jgi:hypothetical protein
MTEKIIYTLKGKDTGGRRYIATDGRELAEYCPQKEEVRKPDKFGRERIVQRAYPEYISINSNRLNCGKSWWGKSYLERAKPEYREEIEELLEKYKGIAVTEHFNL